MKALVLKAVLGILEDAKFYLQKISEEPYSMPLTVYSGATIGQHTRHYIEFFQCLAECLDSARTDGGLVLNYDRRRRDKRIETDPRHAQSAIDLLAAQLPKLDHNANLKLSFTDFATGACTLLPTSVERELYYNIEHTIHHFALIKIGLKIVAPCIVLPEGFGVAPSTFYQSPAFAGHN